MVERARRAKGKKQLLASHARSWIWGRNLVSETLAVGAWPIVELHLADNLPPDALNDATASAADRQIKTLISPRDELTRLCHSAEHQGYLAKMGPYPYATVEEVLARRSAAPLYAILDEIQDPYNFGALLRSAEVFGVEAVFVGAARQARVNSLVARSSVGAVNRIPIAETPDLAQLAVQLKASNVQVIGASATADQDLFRCDLRQPVAFVLGNEGAGLSPAVESQCDSLVRIPQTGAIGSLNVAAAAAVLFYEARRQRTT